MSSRHVPYAAILAIAAVYLVGILLNIWLGGSHAFDLALNTASIGVIFTWGSIFASQIALRKKKGNVSSLPMPGSPWTSWAGLIALLAITVLIGFDTITDKAPARCFPGPLDPGHHPVLRPGAVARLAEGQEQRAQERAFQLARPQPTTAAAAPFPRRPPPSSFPGARTALSFHGPAFEVAFRCRRSGPRSAARLPGRRPDPGRCPSPGTAAAAAAALLGVVHEGVAGRREFLDVVFDPEVSRADSSFAAAPGRVRSFLPKLPTSGQAPSRACSGFLGSRP